MDRNKIIEKANLVIQKQYEMKDIIYELKDELLRMRKENEILKAKLIEAEKTQPVMHVETTEELVKQAPVVKVLEPLKPPKETILKDVVKEATKAKVVLALKPVVSKPIVSERVSLLSEFFLGKNIIAKIASVLIFLGFVSFGQLAYINWLSDVGRVILIFSVGILFFGVGYLFEKRENTVFNNVFYAVGLLITFLSFTLAFNTYGLVGYTSILFASIGLVGLSFTFFYKKRYDFLDFFLFIFYFIILSFLVIYGKGPHSNTIINNIGLGIAFVGLGYVMYTYVIKYKEIKESLQAIGVGIYAVQLIILMTVVGSYNFSTTTQSLLWFLTIFTIYIIYLLNYKFLERKNFYTAVLVGSTLLMALTASMGLVQLLDHYDYLNNYIHILLFMLIILVPMYYYLFRKDKTNEEEYSKLDNYAIFIALFVLIYVFTFQRFNKSITVTPFYVHNMVLGAVMIVSYGLHRYTRKITYKAISYVYFVFLSGAGLVRFLGVTARSPYSRFLEFDGRYVVTNLNTEYLVYISSLVVGIILLAINKWYGKKREENVVESLVLYGLNLFMLIPITFLIVDSFKDTIYLRYGMLMLSAIIIIVVLYRYLLNLKIFEIKYLKEFKVGVLIFAALLITILNFVYLDHDFTLGLDLFTFSVVGVINLYVIVLFKEIYDYYKQKYDLEKTFIIIYLIGVFVQSMFIHRYINFTYDKVFLSSYFIIASALAILYGFRNRLLLVRKLGLGAIYFSLIKFFTYDFFGAEFTLTVRMVTYFVLGLLLMTIAFMYSYLEKKYGEAT